jgi:hypothetical protein
MSKDPACILCHPKIEQSLHICDNCKQFIRDSERQRFFNKSLKTLQQKAERLSDTGGDLDSLRAICQFLIQFVSKMRFSFTPINNINRYHKDKIAESYMEGQERFRNLVPIKSEDDGNCLFNSIIILGQLNENKVSELRVRSLLEVVTNYDTYVKHYSDIESVADNLLEYCRKAKMREHSQLWDVLGLCDTLKCKINLMYFKEPPEYPLQNATYVPITNPQDNTNEITILWTCSLSEEELKISNKQSYGDHFVPLIRYCMKHSKDFIHVTSI